MRSLPNIALEGSVNAGLYLMNMPHNSQSNPALVNKLEEAKQKLREVEELKRQAIAEALMPRAAAVKQAPVKSRPLPPVPKPKTAVCKDEHCELPGKLFIPAKVTYKICPACDRRRKLAAEAKREEERQLQAEIEKTKREADATAQLIADFKAGKAFLCTDEGCNAIERPGLGYDPERPFHCFKHREEYRARRAAEKTQTHGVFKMPMQRVAPVAVVEDTATRAKKRAKQEAEELFRAGGESTLPKGVSLHHRNGRQIILKFEPAGEERFFHAFTLEQSREEKRVQDEAAKKRRHENRQRVDDAPKGKGGHKNQKQEGKKGRK